jgi:hypothetical protein
VKRFSIIVTETGRDNFDLDEHIILRKEHYEGIVSIAKRIDEWGYVTSNISIVCDRCKSFITDALEFGLLIVRLIEFIDSKEFENEFEKWETLFGKLEYIEEKLRIAYPEIDDTDRTTEIAIIFDDKCACNYLFVGDKEEPEEKNQTPEIQKEYDKNIRILKYIGPKKIW